MSAKPNKWIINGQDWSEWSDNELLIDHCNKDTWVVGEVEHEGTRWLVLAECESKKGPAVKLAHPEHPEGRPLKWALASDVRWLKRYPLLVGAVGGDGCQPRRPSMTFSQLAKDTVRDSGKEDPDHA
jgi:hypothetical protein